MNAAIRSACSYIAAAQASMKPLCPHCRQRHDKTGCPLSKCLHCNQLGHYVRACPVLKRKRPVQRTDPVASSEQSSPSVDVSPMDHRPAVPLSLLTSAAADGSLSVRLDQSSPIRADPADHLRLQDTLTSFFGEV